MTHVVPGARRLIVAALVGATAALAVARSTGWAEQTRVTRYVPQTSATTDRTDVRVVLPSTGSS